MQSPSLTKTRLVVAGLLLISSTAAAVVGWPPSPPPALVMTVSETASVARAGEVVWSGVALPRSLDLLDTTSLAVVDGSDQPVPAQLDVLARWHAARDDTTAPIQWLLVAFPASVTANGSSDYRLVTDGSVSNPAPAVPLQVSQDGDQVTVATGAATFVLGDDPTALFDAIQLSGVGQVAGGGAMTAVVDGAGTTHSGIREVRIERSGPLAAAVVIEGTYDMAAVGGGGLGSMRRYEFRAGSATALVRHTLSWEGSRCSMEVLECDGSPNALRLTKVRDEINLGIAQPRTVTAAGAFADSAQVAGVTAGNPASVRQRLRAARLDPLLFEVTVPGTGGATGTSADGGMLAVSDSTAGVAVALDHMHRFEPQALRLLASGAVAVDMVDDNAWLGNHQGLYARLAIHVFAGTGDRTSLDAGLWAPLNHPLRAWPSDRWWAASEAVDELPFGSLPTELAAYDTLVEAVLDDTLDKIETIGLGGIMTFGLYPRFWGHPWYTDELDCSGDPTPAEDWDTAYWCGTWTDYHNTVATAPIWAMRSGQVRWLDEIGFPGALRSLHTQVMQCAPGDTFFYCGQAPSGYGGYRTDNNSSHAYFDNLYLYYWLSGDDTVVRTLRKGGENMRRFQCAGRGSWPIGVPAGPDGPACAPDDPISDPWASLTGRVSTQWNTAFRFLGLTSEDGSFLEDYQANLARGLTQYWVEARQGGTGYGFLFPSGGGSIDPITAPGTRDSVQLWMASQYDTNLLHRLAVDTGDAVVGNPPIAPSSVTQAWARTLLGYGASIVGDGTAGGIWPNQLQATWSGERIGGSLDAVSADVDPDGNGIPCDAYLDECLYNTGKAALTAVLVRSGQDAADPAVLQMGADQVQLALLNAADPLAPLGKSMGVYLSRLHAAVARLSYQVFSDGFENGDTSAWSTVQP